MSNEFSFINRSSTSSGRASSSLIPLLPSSTARIFWEGIVSGRFSHVNRFGGFLNERVYIMYRVCKTRIPVRSDLYFGWRMFFVEEEVDLRRENTVRHMVAPRMTVSAETDSRVMLTRRAAVAVLPGLIYVRKWPRASWIVVCAPPAATKVTMMLMCGQTTGSGADDTDGGVGHAT